MKVLDHNWASHWQVPFFVISPLLGMEMEGGFGGGLDLLRVFKVPKLPSGQAQPAPWHKSNYAQHNANPWRLARTQRQD